MDCLGSGAEKKTRGGGEGMGEGGGEKFFTSFSSELSHLYTESHPYKKKPSSLHYIVVVHVYTIPRLKTYPSSCLCGDEWVSRDNSRAAACCLSLVATLPRSESHLLR